MKVGAGRERFEVTVKVVAVHVIMPVKLAFVIAVAYSQDVNPVSNRRAFVVCSGFYNLVSKINYPLAVLYHRDRRNDDQSSVFLCHHQ